MAGKLSFLVQDCFATSSLLGDWTIDEERFPREVLQLPYALLKKKQERGYLSAPLCACGFSLTNLSRPIVQEELLYRLPGYLPQPVRSYADYLDQID